MTMDKTAKSIQIDNDELSWTLSVHEDHVWEYLGLWQKWQNKMVCGTGKSKVWWEENTISQCV